MESDQMTLMRRPRVVFIGGTSRSGSTFLDVVLGNRNDALSLGEVQYLFYPTRHHHYDVRGRLADEQSKLSRIYRNGARQLFPGLMGAYPDIATFIDSSKSPLWIKKQSAILSELGVPHAHILIHKSLRSLYTSYSKRGLAEAMIPSYIDYHRWYFAECSSFWSVGHSDLVEKPETWYALATRLGVPFQSDMIYYNGKNSPLFFGSKSLELRLHSKGISEPGDIGAPTPSAQNNKIEAIKKVLEFTDVSNVNLSGSLDIVRSKASYGRVSLFARRTRATTFRYIRRVFPSRYIAYQDHLLAGERGL